MRWCVRYRSEKNESGSKKARTVLIYDDINAAHAGLDSCYPYMDMFYGRVWYVVEEE